MDLQEIEQKILEYVDSQTKGRTPTTQKDIMSKFNISYPTASKYIWGLVNRGFLRFEDNKTIPGLGNVKFYFTTSKWQKQQKD